MNDIVLTFNSIFIDFLCLNIFMILKLDEPKSNKKAKIKQTSLIITFLICF